MSTASACGTKSSAGLSATMSSKSATHFWSNNRCDANIVKFIAWSHQTNLFLIFEKVHDWSSGHQSVAIPIPRYKPLDSDSKTFVGRLARELLRQTDPHETMYLWPMSGWFSPSDGKELVGLRTFELLKSAVGVVGLAGLDRLFCFMIVFRVQVKKYFLNIFFKQKISSIVCLFY